MKLIGLLDQSLGGFTTIRGYAVLKDLTRASKAENSFQRELIEEHKNDIQRFLSKKESLFFPEVVLGYTLKYNYAIGVTGTAPLQDIITRKGFVSNVDNIKFKCQKGKLNIVTVDIDEGWLNTNVPFSRIDGNHRLSAAVDNDLFNEYLAPFCLMLFLENDETEKIKKTIFHNINSKAVSLTSEENLKGIIEDEGNFTDQELIDEFGHEYLLVRKLSSKIPNQYFQHIFPNIQAAFYSSNNSLHKFSISLNLLNFLISKEIIAANDEGVDITHEALIKVNQVFGNHNKLLQTTNSAFLIAATYIAITDSKDLKAFTNWLANNHLGELKEITAQSVLDIYMKIHEQGINVFVAMPYFQKDEVASFNATYQRVVDKISSENADLKIKLNPIMVHEGGTKDIVVDMLQQIENSKIFIADITKANANVAYELGYARSLKIPTIIVRQEDDHEKVPFDYEHDVRSPYNSKAHTTLEESVYRDIKAILIDEYDYTFN